MLFLSYKIEYLNLHFLPNCFIFVLDIIDIYINKKHKMANDIQNNRRSKQIQ